MYMYYMPPSLKTPTFYNYISLQMMMDSAVILDQHHLRIYYSTQITFHATCRVQLGNSNITI